MNRLVVIHNICHAQFIFCCFCGQIWLVQSSSPVQSSPVHQLWCVCVKELTDTVITAIIAHTKVLALMELLHEE